MISLVTGKVCSLNAPVACVMTQSGIGYDIELPIPSFCALTLGSDVTLFTHLHVREDAHLLFGFIEKSDRDIFKKLIKINGVGAKMALAILSTLSTDELKQAVEYNDDSTLVKVPGIGKKTAQRLLIELKDKLQDVALTLPTGSDFTDDTPSDNPLFVVAEVQSALMSLGYKEKEAQLAIKSAQSTLDTVDTASLLKASLKKLSGF
jgi:Holliday junction DNA helicase RuvA